MRIAVSTDEIWNGDRTSITFALGLLSELPGALSEHTLVFHTDIPEEHDWGNVEVIDRYANAKADTYLSFSQGYFEEIAGVTTVFDFDLWQEPVNFVWKLFGRTGKDPLRYLRSEAKLIVTNENFRQTLVGQGIEPSKIINVGYGLPDKNQRILPADPVTRRITKEVYGKEHSYFYAPASGHESDNLERLFAAYDIFRARVPEPVRLLVQFPESGTKHSRAVRRAKKRAKFSADIVFLPVQSDHDHRKVFSSARAVVYPSLSTRFPLPVLDAWTAEIPVLYTDNDILQGAGALVQGTDEQSIAEGMVSLVTTPFLASGLVENGKRRLQDFSWEAVAERVAGVLRAVGGV